MPDINESEREDIRNFVYGVCINVIDFYIVVKIVL